MRVQVNFERVGRSRSVPLLVVDADDGEGLGDAIAAAVHRHVRRFLKSKDYDVDVFPDGRVLIGWGRSGAGEWRELVSACP